VGWDLGPACASDSEITWTLRRIVLCLADARTTATLRSARGRRCRRRLARSASVAALGRPLAQPLSVVVCATSISRCELLIAKEEAWQALANGTSRW
jgi:hypothetical protein